MSVDWAYWGSSNHIGAWAFGWRVITRPGPAIFLSPEIGDEGGVAFYSSEFLFVHEKFKKIPHEWKNRV